MSADMEQNKYNKIDKQSIEFYLNELSKELRKEFGRNVNIEMVVVGGASILINYGFRDNTSDIDAIITSRTSIKDAINRVGDKYNLENGWVNSDFRKTASYSPKLIECSKYYKTYNHILTVRTVKEEYLIAMKLASMRNYKNDLSDVIGILTSESGQQITFNKIDIAVTKLYGGWDFLPSRSKEFLLKVLDNSKIGLYEQQRQEESQNKVILSEFEEKYTGVLDENNLQSILDSVKRKKESVLDKLHANQEIVEKQENKNISHDKKCEQCKRER